MQNNIDLQVLNVSEAKKQQRVLKILLYILIYSFLGFMAIIVIFPFYWMIISSLKTLTEYRLNTPTFWPQQIFLENFRTAYEVANLGQLFLNTLYVGTVSTILSLVVTFLVPLLLQDCNLKAVMLYCCTHGNDDGSWRTLHHYQLYDSYQVGTYQYLYRINCSVLSKCLLYLSFATKLYADSNELICRKSRWTSDMKYLWKVMIPLCIPTLITITILKMMGAWNSYIWPRLVANDDAHKLITNGLRGASFTDEANVTNFQHKWPLLSLCRSHFSWSSYFYVNIL
jgi:multiple sugar transport system permease protein